MMHEHNVVQQNFKRNTKEEESQSQRNYRYYGAPVLTSSGTGLVIRRKAVSAENVRGKVEGFTFACREEPDGRDPNSVTEAYTLTIR
jgi:hypothetical protein